MTFDLAALDSSSQRGSLTVKEADLVKKVDGVDRQPLVQFLPFREHDGTAHVAASWCMCACVSVFFLSFIMIKMKEIKASPHTLAIEN